MKGFKLRVLVLLIIALVAPLLLFITDPNAFGSISQYDGNNNDIFFQMFIIAAGLLYWSQADLITSRVNKVNFIKGYARTNEVLYKPFKITVRRKHLDRFISISFFCILLFSVNDYGYIFHLLATGLASLGVVLRMFKEDLKEKAFGGLAMVLFLLGLATNLYSTFVGEYLFTLIAVAYMYNENRKLT